MSRIEDINLDTEIRDEWWNVCEAVMKEMTEDEDE